MFLPQYDVYRVSITEKTAAKCYLLVLYNKKVKDCCQIGFAVQRKDFRTPFDVIMIYTKQNTLLAVNSSEMA